MNESKPRHPLFDPDSLYNHMRATIRPQYKMLGYLHWMAAHAGQVNRPPIARSPEEQERYRRDSGVLAARLTGESAGETGLVVLDAIRVGHVYLTGGGRFREAGCGSVCLCREPDGTRTVGMWLECPVPPRRRCRAFLIEPEGFPHLRTVVSKACGVGPEETLTRFFTPEAIVREDVARLLTAIPDLDGESDGREVRTRRLPVGDFFDVFPPRVGELTVVVAFDDEAARG